MPSNTFFNLHPEKQEAILGAAKNEFSSVPFAEVSINRIVKDANIARGSFYMYFRDIYDLVDYLMRQFRDDLFQKMRLQLIIRQGDLFEAMLDLHDDLYKQYEDQKERLFFMNLASHFHSDLSAHMQRTEEMMERFNTIESLVRLIDRDKYEFESSRDGLRLIEVTFILLRHQLYQSMVRSYNMKDARQSLANQYKLLFYGVAKQKASETPC